ncbi:MAG: tryptophan synthase subunit alpha [Armatimonadota bacterium]
MSRIGDAFERLTEAGDTGLIIFVTCGDPSLDATVELVPVIESAGADIVELGIPFSDPLADGPIIQAASHRALEAGCTTDAVLDCARRVRQRSEVPLLLMTCYNPILQYGIERFGRAARDAGVDGVLVSDLPPHEAGPLLAAARENALDTIFLVAPTSTPQRMRKVCELSTGFVYCVSRTGVTGVREELPPDLTDLVASVRRQTDKPIGVGFGISTAAHVRAVTQQADAAIVGSAVVRLIERTGPRDELPNVVGEFVRSLALGKSRH